MLLHFVSIVLGFTMVTEIIRQRSRKALVEVSLGKGRVGAGMGERREAPHGPLSIHWARSSSPVLQQLPARLVRVNKPSAKVKETYKKDIMQTVISADPAEPQIEWRNRFCSLHPPCSPSESESREKGARFPRMAGLWIQYEPSAHSDTEGRVNTKTDSRRIRWRRRWHSPAKNNRYLLIPLQEESDSQNADVW